MQITLNNALDRINTLSVKAKSEAGLTFEESSEFEALSQALQNLELPNKGYKVGPQPIKPKNQYLGNKPSGMTFKEPNGNLIRAYKQHDPFLTEATIEPGEVGAMIKAMLLGGDHLPTGVNRLSNSHGDDPTNLSYSIPTYISKKLYDLARAKSVTQTAGVQTVPVQGGSLSFIQITQDLVPEFRGTISNAWHPLTFQMPQFNQVQLVLRSIGCLTGISLEMAGSSSNSETWLENIMSSATAAAIDSAVLCGQGGNAPQGIVGTSGVNRHYRF